SGRRFRGGGPAAPAEGLGRLLRPSHEEGLEDGQVRRGGRLPTAEPGTWEGWVVRRPAPAWQRAGRRRRVGVRAGDGREGRAGGGRGVHGPCRWAHQGRAGRRPPSV